MIIGYHQNDFHHRHHHAEELHRGLPTRGYRSVEWQRLSEEQKKLIGQADKEDGEFWSVLQTKLILP